MKLSHLIGAIAIVRPFAIKLESQHKADDVAIEELDQSRSSHSGLRLLLDSLLEPRPTFVRADDL